jgi:hypothetical protein
MNTATTMKNHKLVKLLLPLVLICIVSFGSASRSSAQISDVFSTAFKTFAGFNVWTVVPAYLGGAKSATGFPFSTNSNQYTWGYSVKFKPLGFGDLIKDNTTISRTQVSITFSALSGSVVLVEYDTNVYSQQTGARVGGGIYRTTIGRTIGDALPTSTSLTSYDTARTREYGLTLNLGYSGTPTLSYQEGGFSTNFSINSLFLTAVTRPFPKKLPGLAFGGSLYVPSITNVPAQFVGSANDTTRLRITSALAFSPELFIGVATDDVLLFTLPKGSDVFLDFGYRWQTFRSITYTGPDGKEPANVSHLPTVIDASNFYLKLGLSFNVFGS